MTTTFFASTAAYQKQHTDLFDFISPTAAALWNLRWQVRGYLAAAPEATKEELDARFILGSGIQGANLRRAAVEHTWEQQTEQFARQVLFVAIALYEGWLQGTTRIFPQPKTRAEELQRPSQGFAGRAARGVRDALATMRAHPSRLIESAFTPALIASSKYSGRTLDGLLICYSYFKLMRNALLHRGGLAHQSLVTAEPEFSRLRPADLGTKQVPEARVPVLDQPISVTLRGVIGFTGVVFRIVTTLDAELAATTAGELELTRRWITKHPRREVYPAARRKVERRIRREASQAGLPQPVTNELDLYELLKRNHAVR